jgi:hypothetical protein
MHIDGASWVRTWVLVALALAAWYACLWYVMQLHPTTVYIHMKHAVEIEE